jgi:hypothetical protein
MPSSPLFESGARKRGSWGAYGLFDQVLVPFGSASSKRGFGVFGSVTVAPDLHVQQLPLYFTAGVSARGKFDGRPRDAVSFGVASGYFSEARQRAQQHELLLGPDGCVQDRETVVELSLVREERPSAQQSICRKFIPNWAPNTSAFLSWPVPPGWMIYWKSGCMKKALLRKAKR